MSTPSLHQKYWAAGQIWHLWAHLWVWCALSRMNYDCKGGHSSAFWRSISAQLWMDAYFLTSMARIRIFKGVYCAGGYSIVQVRVGCSLSVFLLFSSQILKWPCVRLVSTFVHAGTALSKWNLGEDQLALLLVNFMTSAGLGATVAQVNESPSFAVNLLSFKKMGW